MPEKNQNTALPVELPGIGIIPADSGMLPLRQCSGGMFAVGKDGVVSIVATGDRKVEFIAFADRTLARVNSALGYPAYYPVLPVRYCKPIRAVLMDLDGTSIRSEEFWVWIIQRVVSELLGRPDFEFEPEDLPFVSGHSVSEHLRYALGKYCPDKSLETARAAYFRLAHEELRKIESGAGRLDAFKPSAGLKEFLGELKAAGVAVALVSSGLYEKAWPGILAAFRAMGLGEPAEFYDAIITAGFPLRRGAAGTLGELCPKPHPWLYAEAARIGLGIDFKDRDSVVGIEDSGAGVCAIRLAGFAPFGLSGGNIEKSGTRALCAAYCSSFEEIVRLLV